MTRLKNLTLVQKIDQYKNINPRKKIHPRKIFFDPCNTRHSRNPRNFWTHVTHKTT